MVSRRQTTADASPVIAAIIANGLAHELAVTPKPTLRHPLGTSRPLYPVV